MNLVPLLYVGFRIIPFILVCFFVLSSIINSDIRGFIFLGLLLLNCGAVLLFDTMFGGMLQIEVPDTSKPTCNAIGLGNANERMSTLPLNISIVSFTYAYLVYLLGVYKQVDQNVHTIVFFAVLLLSMIIWEVSNTCVGMGAVVVSMIISIGLGVGFCEMLDVLAKKQNIKGVHFFSTITNDTDVCRVTNEELFECSSS
jgi:hypothetical protein